MKRLRSRFRTVSSASSFLPIDGSPTLVMDFVTGDQDTDWVALSLSFTSQSYEVYTADPIAPDTKINLLVWN